MTLFIIFVTLLSVKFTAGISGKSTDLWFFTGSTLSLLDRSKPSLRSLATRAGPLLPSLSVLFEIYCAHLSRRETTKSNRKPVYSIRRFRRAFRFWCETFLTTRKKFSVHPTIVSRLSTLNRKKDTLVIYLFDILFCFTIARVQIKIEICFTYQMLHTFIYSFSFILDVLCLQTYTI